MKFMILGKPWTIRILSERQYVLSHGGDSVAITNIKKRQIDLSPYGVDKGTIAHELVHAYVSSMCVSSMDGDFGSFEEFFAEFISIHGKELLALSETLMYRLNKSKK